MGGRYGKYGDAKRKAKLRQSGNLKRKVDKKIQNPRNKRRLGRKPGG